jgi:hypothetical protein
MIQGAQANQGSTQRKRFAAALALFLGWVALLAVLAAVSSYRPNQRAKLPDELAPAAAESSHVDQ